MYSHNAEYTSHGEIELATSDLGEGAGSTTKRPAVSERRAHAIDTYLVPDEHSPVVPSHALNLPS